ncbi:MAG: dihydrodipicolinate synthase family protein [Burkholderiaceae bacterium]
MIAGLAGRTDQALREVWLAARAHGYHAGMLALSARSAHASVDELIEHCAAVAATIPLVGFTQTAVGGISVPEDFWTRFARIENVIAVKLAPFDRYKTLAAVRGTVAAGAQDKVTLYTGNDDHIVLDSLTPYRVMRDGQPVTVRTCSGTGASGPAPPYSCSSAAIAAVASGTVDVELLAMDSKVTDCTAAVFDVLNRFAGVIPGCYEVLRRQGLLQGTWCLDPNEKLSPGQADLITRVANDHPELVDDAFVAANLDRWLTA